MEKIMARLLLNTVEVIIVVHIFSELTSVKIKLQKL